MRAVRLSVILGVGLCLSQPTMADAADHPRTSSSASSCVGGCAAPSWSSSNAIDGLSGTSWSSTYHSTSAGYEWHAFFFGLFADTNYVRIVPRVSNGVSISVPEHVNIYYSGVNGQWNFVNTVSLPASINPRGYTLKIPTVYANGILLTTSVLRSDGAGGYYFQMSEVYAGWSNRYYSWDQSWETANGIPLQTTGLDTRQDRQHVSCSYTASGGSCSSVAAFATANPGRLYILGDEPDMVCTPVAQLATIYHDFVVNTLAADATARFSPPGFAQPNGACSNGQHFTDYAQSFYDAHVTQYGVAPRVDEWRFHAFGYAASYAPIGNCSQWTRTIWLGWVNQAAAWSNAKGASMVLGSFGMPDPADAACDIVGTGWEAEMLTTILNDSRIVGAAWFAYPSSWSAHSLAASGGALSAEGALYQSYLNR